MKLVRRTNIHQSEDMRSIPVGLYEIFESLEVRFSAWSGLVEFIPSLDEAKIA